MNTYFLLGSYFPGEVRNIAAHRTAEMQEIVSRAGGNVLLAYALMGRYDLVLIVEMPNMEAAVQIGVALSKVVGAAFQTSAALPIEVFDNLIENFATEIESARMEAGE